MTDEELLFLEPSDDDAALLDIVEFLEPTVDDATFARLLDIFEVRSHLF